MSETPDFAPDSDSDVRRYVRALTDYDDSPDELQQIELQTQMDIAKLDIYNDVGSDKFYTDAGLGQALIATTAIYAKAAVENYSISGWQIGDQQIDVRGVSDGTDVQFQRWATLAATGLQASDATPDHTPTNTSDYIGSER